MADPTQEVFNQSEPLAGYNLFGGIIERAMPR